jgi:predicted transcriptional regulator
VGPNLKLDEILKAGAAGGPSKLQRAIERILRVSPQLTTRQLLKRAAELKLTNWYRPWSTEEKGYVLEYARELSVVEIARYLRRTPAAVRQMLWRNRISAKVQDGYTQSEIAEIFHVSPRKVRHWISVNWLALSGGRIKDRSLNRFLREHPEEIDLARIDKEFRLWFLDSGLKEDGDEMLV